MLALPQSITHANASQALAQLLPQLQQAAGGTVSLSAAELQQFDSSALALLLECQRQLQNQGKQLQLEQAPQRLLELGQLYGIAVALGLPPAAAPSA